MKKIVLFISAGLLLLLQACYDEYKLDNEYTATYFARQYPLRTLVEEDGMDMSLEVGVALGGKYENTVDEVVNFNVDESLLNEYPDLTKLPDSYYSIESNEIVIPSGEFKGSIKVTLNKESFLNDQTATGIKYALPLKITSASTDSILSGKEFTIIVIRYYNKYHGYYYVKGADYELDASNNRVSSHIYSKPDLVRNLDMLLETTAKSSLLVPYIGRFYNNEKGYAMDMDISGEGACTLTGDDTSLIKEVSGSGNYQATDKTFTLHYNFTDEESVKHEVFDTLYYRNTELNLEEWK